MEDRFLGVLVPCVISTDPGTGREQRDYALEIPLGAFFFPEFMTTDCDLDDIEDCVVAHVRPYAVQAAQASAQDASAQDASIGAAMTFDAVAGKAIVYFKEIFIGGVDYPSMTLLKESGALATMLPGLRDKVHALIQGYHTELQKAVADASRDSSWLPAGYRAFATHYADETYAGWEDVHWFAQESESALSEWLERHPFRMRKAWCRHPCNNALVIAMESADDAKALEEWLAGK